jgi:hypothetical protein
MVPLKSSCESGQLDLVRSRNRCPIYWVERLEVVVATIGVASALLRYSSGKIGGGMGLSSPLASKGNKVTSVYGELLEVDRWI